MKKTVSVPPAHAKTREQQLRELASKAGQTDHVVYVEVSTIQQAMDVIEKARVACDPRLSFRSDGEGLAGGALGVRNRLRRAMDAVGVALAEWDAHV